MEPKSTNHRWKYLTGLAMAGVVFCLAFGMSGSPAALAQEAATPTPNPYYTVNLVTLADGTVLDQAIINGPPKPPPGFELERQAVSLPEPDVMSAANSLIVPAFDWVFGCSSVSGAMIAGYYDRNGFPNMYTGPTNGGVMPLDNSSWPTWSDGLVTYPNLPLAASKNGVDGRVTKGSIDDYWVAYGSSTADPYITGVWTQHLWGTAIGDYMKTSQSAYSNTDGGTMFWTYTSSAAQLTCSDMVTGGITNDGTVGRKLFYEARGYTVTDCYNQKTDNTVTGGFSYAMYKAQIDAGRPVMLNLAGHTIVGVGYNDPNTIYIHDTWDYLTHEMTWGASYSGMALQSVSIVNLASASVFPLTVSKTGTGSGTVTSSPPGIDCGSTCSYNFANNTVVTLTATPTAPSNFGGWSGAGCSGTGTCVVTMSEARSVSATFNPSGYQTLTMLKTGTGSGSVTSNPAGIDCGSTCMAPFTDNTSVILTAVANTGSTFTGWSGVSCPGTGTCTVIMDTAKSVTANFNPSTYKIYLPLVLRNYSPTASGIVNGSFESGQGVGWTEYSNHGWDIILNSGFPGGVTPRTGSWAAWLGGDDNEIAYFQQQVSISAGAPYLNYYQWIASADSCGFDYAGVLINGTSVYGYDLCDSANTGTWVPLSINLSAYIGQSVMLQIRVETDSSYNSNLFVDDVSLQGSASPSGPVPGYLPNLEAPSTQGKNGIVLQGEKQPGNSENILIIPK